MATIYNTDLFKEIKDGAKIQQLTDAIPTQLQGTVVPVMEVNPKLFRRCNISRRGSLVNATSATIYTTPSDKDFFITAASLSFIKDATATTTVLSVTCTIDGITSYIFSIPTLTTTVHTAEISNAFPAPIRVDRGTAITVASGTNVGNISATGVIQGYLVENINA